MAELSVTCDSSGACPDSEGTQGRALLQADIHRTHAQSKVVSETKTKTKTALNASVNPSGAAAPLDQEGYAAVADRCCHAEMAEFIRRQALNLNLEVCDADGLKGITPFHSCEAGPLTFDALSSNLLDDSVKTCTWVAPTGQCKPYPGPPTCPEFSSSPASPDCGCSRSAASNLDFFTATVSQNNLDGKGPDAGVAELRYSNAGTTKDGIPFDLVVTSSGPYRPLSWYPNGKRAHFGVIGIDCNPGARIAGPTEFTVSFVEPGTNNPVVQPEVHFALFDLDGKDTGGLEWASSKGYKGYVTDTVPTIVASGAPGGGTKFSSSGRGQIPNPSNPDTLTAIQRANSVMYFFAGVSSFQLNFGVDPCTSGRALFFAGKSALNDRCGA